MSELLKNPHHSMFFIDGEWVTPAGSDTIAVINPATEQPIAEVVNGTQADVDRAVGAAVHAFPAFAATSKAERIDLLTRIIEVYQGRTADIATAITAEMGAPVQMAVGDQTDSGTDHFQQTLSALVDHQFDRVVGSTIVTQEPVGVCAMITPWNWPINQIASKVAPALAAGCTMVLKPSEVAPLSPVIFAEVLAEAGVPAGVFNLVQGDGPSVGVPLSSHPDVDMVSFTGSTRAGIDIARNAAPTVKRVAQELGGKSPNIICDDVDVAAVVARDVAIMCSNSGQDCDAGTRILVPHHKMHEALAAAKAAADALVVGDPTQPDTDLGPVVSAAQFDKIQRLIQAGTDEGATLVTGGPGRPDGLATGYYVRPTVFGNVTNDMTIAREEIFGPVVSILGYGDIDEAIEIANDTPYGLAGYVSSGDVDRAMAIGRRLRAGTVRINGTPIASDVPFGGYKQSGNGREYGIYGMHDYLEYKSIFGANPTG